MFLFFARIVAETIVHTLSSMNPWFLAVLHTGECLGLTTLQWWMLIVVVAGTTCYLFYCMCFDVSSRCSLLMTVTHCVYCWVVYLTGIVCTCFCLSVTRCCCVDWYCFENMSLIIIAVRGWQFRVLCVKNGAIYVSTGQHCNFRGTRENLSKNRQLHLEFRQSSWMYVSVFCGVRYICTPIKAYNEHRDVICWCLSIGNSCVACCNGVICLIWLRATESVGTAPLLRLHMTSAFGGRAWPDPTPCSETDPYTCLLFTKLSHRPRTQPAIENQMTCRFPPHTDHHGLDNVAVPCGSGP